MGLFTRACVRCEQWFFTGPSNAAGKASAGWLLAEGPVCNACLQAADRTRDLTPGNGDKSD